MTSKYITKKYLPFIFLLLITVAGLLQPLYAQRPANRNHTKPNPKNIIHIIHADRDGIQRVGDSTETRFFSGHVALRQNGTLFECDSAVNNSTTQVMEAFGHVHINDNDTVNLYADYMRYQGMDRKVFMSGNVKLKDKKGSLTTPQLDYDLNTKVATYSMGGKLLNGTTNLTSSSGVYNSDTRDANFNGNVVLIDPQYTIKTDTLLYNTYTKVATFTVPTKITSGKNRSIETSDGYYDEINRKSYFGKRPTIKDSSSTLIADEVAADDKSGFGEARGTVIYKDTAQGIVLLCGDLRTNRVQSSFLALVNPVMVLKQNADSVFISADTLYSAKFAEDSTDSIGQEDSAKITNPDYIPHTEAADSAASDSSVVKTATQVTDKQPVAQTTVPTNVSATTDSLPGQPKKEKKGFLGGLFRKKNSKPAPAGPQPKIIAKDTLPAQKGILNIFHKKENEGKKTPSIIDSTKAAGQRSAEIDSTAGKGHNFNLSPGAKANKADSAVQQEDTKSRFIEGYAHVRIFSDSLQAIGDSMYYSSRDSLFQLFKKPVVWTNSNNQITQLMGDTINMYTANNKPKYLKVWNNGLMISQADTLKNKSTQSYFNQIAGRTIEAWFTNGQVDSVAANGNAQSVYYLLDANNRYIGVNAQSSKIIDIYFAGKAMQRIVPKYDIEGKMYPMRQANHEQLRLKGFEWLDDKRPKSKFDLLAH